MLAAAVLAALLVRPSRNTLDAALAAAAEVRSLGALLCVNALPAAFRTVVLLEVRKTLAAALAALLPVPRFIIYLLSTGRRENTIT